MWALGLGSQAWGPPRGGTGPPRLHTDAIQCGVGRKELSVPPAGADPALSTPQPTRDCRATP